MNAELVLDFETSFPERLAIPTTLNNDVFLLLQEWLDKVVLIINNEEKQVLAELRLLLKNEQTRWQHDYQRQRIPGQPFDRKENDDDDDGDTIVDVIPQQWLPSPNTLAILSDMARLPLPFEVRRLANGPVEKTLDDLEFHHLVILFQCLTARDLWASVAPISVSMAEIVRSNVMFDRLGAKYWALSVSESLLDKLLKKELVCPPHLQICFRHGRNKEIIDPTRFRTLSTQLDIYSIKMETDRPLNVRQGKWESLRELALVPKFADDLHDRPVNERFLNGCQNLKTLYIEDMPLTQLPDLKQIETVELVELPYIEDISGLAKCQSVIITNCESIRDFSPLKSCRCVELYALNDDCGSFRELAFVDDLSISIQQNQTTIMTNQLKDFLDVPNHRHKRLQLKGTILCRLDTLSSVEHLSLSHSKIMHPEEIALLRQVQDLEYDFHVSDDDEIPFIINELKTLKQLKRFTVHLKTGFYRPDLESLMTTLGASANSTHIRIIGSEHIAWWVTSCLADVKRLSIIGGDLTRLHTLEEVELLWLVGSYSARDWYALERFVEQRRQHNPLFECYCNGAPMRNMRAIRDTIEYLAMKTELTHLPDIAQSVDNRTFVSFPISRIHPVDSGTNFYIRQTITDTEKIDELEDICMAPHSTETKPKEPDQNVIFEMRNGEQVTLERSVAIGSILVQNMIEDQTTEANVLVPVPNIPDAESFAYCRFFLEGMRNPKNISDPELIQLPLDMNLWQTTLTLFEIKFLKHVWDSQRMMDIFFMADYLDIRPMCQLVLYLIASIIKGRSAHSLREIFCMQNARDQFDEYPALQQELKATARFMQVWEGAHPKLGLFSIHD